MDRRVAAPRRRRRRDRGEVMCRGPRTPRALAEGTGSSRGERGTARVYDIDEDARASVALLFAISETHSCIFARLLSAIARTTSPHFPRARPCDLPRAHTSVSRERSATAMSGRSNVAKLVTFESTQQQVAVYEKSEPNEVRRRFLRLPRLRAHPLRRAVRRDRRARRRGLVRDRGTDAAVTPLGFSRRVRPETR